MATAVKIVLIAILCYQITAQSVYHCDPDAACGCASRPATVSKIIGGELAAANTWPWAVSLYYHNNFRCGAAIIAESWVLTAAHCVEDLNLTALSVSAGSQEIYDFKQYRRVVSYKIHPNYNPDTVENDIALLNIQYPFNMTDKSVKKICLPSITDFNYPPVNADVKSFCS